MSDAPTFKLMVIIIDQPDLVDELVTGFLDIGVRGATIIESHGMGQIVRKEMPIFAGLASLFPENTGSRMVMSVMPEELCERVTELVDEIGSQFGQPNTAICFTLPVETFRGIRH